MNSITKSDYDQILDKAAAIQCKWREIPAPRRGELLRVFGNQLRESQESKTVNNRKEGNNLLGGFQFKEIKIQ